MMMMMDGSNQRYRLEFYVQALNILNHVNYQGYVGNLQLEDFGSPISAGPARRNRARHELRLLAPPAARGTRHEAPHAGHKARSTVACLSLPCGRVRRQLEHAAVRLPSSQSFTERRPNVRLTAVHDGPTPAPRRAAEKELAADTPGPVSCGVQ